MKVNLVNNNGGKMKVKVGFSWTMFFFGVFVPLFRGDIKWFLITLIAGAMTLGLSNLVFMFIYNGLYIKDRIKEGYKAGDTHSEAFLTLKGFL